MFINKSLFEKAGVSFPPRRQKTWTWTDFIAAANKVREKTGAKYSLTFDQSPSRLRAMVYEMGGQYVHADSSGKFSVDAATKKAVNTFVGLERRQDHAEVGVDQRRRPVRHVPER